MSTEQYILKRNLIRENGDVVEAGKPLPDDIPEESIEVYLKKGIIRKKQGYKRPAPILDNRGD